MLKYWSSVEKRGTRDGAYREGTALQVERSQVHIQNGAMGVFINPLTPELNSSTQSCMTRYFYWGFCF
jgi:hypothetical protein